jgi:succinoglycan biosynthesis protein ExoM
MNKNSNGRISEMIENNDHITVCICTYKRPKMLARLITRLENQKTEGLFSYSVVVVDNDCKESAKKIVSATRQKTSIDIRYYVEPIQNIALARNKAVFNARGTFIAMIDDDEMPIAEWLFLLFKTLKHFKADGVLGPVRPYFTPQAPQWLIDSSLCDRHDYDTGRKLTCKDQLRTGNVLVHRRIFNGNKNLFEERFGKSGGEDIAFFDNRINEGFTFIWCNEAPVYEEVINERCRLSFHLKKYIRLGGLTGEKMRYGSFPSWGSFFKSVLATTAYPMLFLILVFNGKHVLARHLVKYVYHISRLLGLFGIVIIRDRQSN